MPGCPRWMSHRVEFWQDVIHMRKKWQPTPVFVPQEIHDQYKKAKRYYTGRRVAHVRRCSICYWGRASAITKSYRKTEVAGPKWERCPAVDVSGAESKLQCWKEQYCTGTRFMKQGKLDMVKQEMARLNSHILRIIMFFEAENGEVRHSQQQQKRLEDDCGSDHQSLTAKFRLRLKKVGKITSAFRYDLN